ncbi:hypothetical protein BaRGS_00002389 [Batillaria attramentaria]|uniref:Uncharacterized protein n=1 Tax=Batillaria attramentaria TaxID=370345 RepID=A0ABD0M4U5_9CAEN
MTVKRRRQYRVRPEDIDKYDVIKRWDFRKDIIRTWSREQLEEDFSITIIDQPKLIRSAVPDSYVREFAHHQTYFNDVFHLVSSHIRVGHWTVGKNGRTIETKTLELPYPVLHLLYVQELRAYIGLNLDMEIVLIATLKGVMKHVSQGDQLQRAQRILFIPETKQIVFGGFGFLKAYTCSGLECAVCIEDGRLINTSLGEDEIIHQLKLDPNYQRLFAVTERGTIVINYIDGGMRIYNTVSAVKLALMYPLTTLQVVDKYVYNAYRQRLYIVLTGGEVLVLSCKKSPFRALHLYKPHTQDEGVTCLCSTVLAIGERGAEIEDMVVFMGMKNGQISLLSSDCFAMPKPVQAHHGYISCMDFLAETDDSVTHLHSTSNILVSVGSEQIIKMWKLRCQPDETAGLKLRFHVILEIRGSDLPMYLSASVDRLCVVFAKKTTVLMYDVSRALQAPETEKTLVRTYTCLKHTPDYDHTGTVTALDKCPLLGIFATASIDHTVKIWSRNNELLRELVFVDGLVDMCFATDIGDLFIGKEFSVVIDPSRVPHRPFPRFNHHYLARQAFTRPKMKAADWQIHWTGRRGTKHCMNIPVTFHPRRSSLFESLKKLDLVMPRNISSTQDVGTAKLPITGIPPGSTRQNLEDDEQPPELRALRCALEAGGAELLAETYERLTGRNPSKEGCQKVMQAMHRMRGQANKTDLTVEPCECSKEGLTCNCTTQEMLQKLLDQELEEMMRKAQLPSWTPKAPSRDSRPSALEALKVLEELGAPQPKNIPRMIQPDVAFTMQPKEKTLPEEVKQDDRAATPRFSMQRASLGAVAESLKGKLEEDLTTADRLAVFLHATAKKAREAAASKVWVRVPRKRRKTTATSVKAPSAKSSIVPKEGDQDIDPVSLMLGTHNIPDKMDILRVHTKRKSESTPAKDESAEIDMSPQSSSDEEVDDGQAHRPSASVSAAKLEPTGVFAEFYRPVEKVEKKYSVKEMMKRLGAEEELKQTTSDNLSIVLTDQRQIRSFIPLDELRQEWVEDRPVVPQDIVKHTKRMKAPVLPNSLFKKKPKLKPSPKPKSDSLTGKALALLDDDADDYRAVEGRLDSWFETQYGDDDESTQGQFFKGAKKKMKAVTQDTIEDSAKDDKPTTPQRVRRTWQPEIVTEEEEEPEGMGPSAEKRDATSEVSVEKAGTESQLPLKKGGKTRKISTRKGGVTRNITVEIRGAASTVSEEKFDTASAVSAEKGDTTEKVLAEKVDTTEKVSVEKEGTTEKESVKKGDTASDVPKRRLSASKASKRRRVDDILRRLAKENWFPKGVPFNLQNMFDALMQLLQPETDSKVLVKAIRGHLRDMIRHGELSPEMKATALGRLALLVDHPDKGVQLDILEILPDLYKELNDQALRVLCGFLPSEEPEVQAALMEVFKKYGIRDHAHLHELMTMYNISEDEGRKKKENKYVSAHSLVVRVESLETTKVEDRTDDISKGTEKRQEAAGIVERTERVSKQEETRRETSGTTDRTERVSKRGETLQETSGIVDRTERVSKGEDTWQETTGMVERTERVSKREEIWQETSGMLERTERVSKGKDSWQETPRMVDRTEHVSKTGEHLPREEEKVTKQTEQVRVYIKVKPAAPKSEQVAEHKEEQDDKRVAKVSGQPTRPVLGDTAASTPSLAESSRQKRRRLRGMNVLSTLVSHTGALSSPSDWSSASDREVEFPPLPRPAAPKDTVSFPREHLPFPATSDSKVPHGGVSQLSVSSRDAVGTKDLVATPPTPLFPKPLAPLPPVCPLDRPVPKPAGVSQLSIRPDSVVTKHSVASSLTPSSPDASKPLAPIRFVCPLKKTVPKPGGGSQLSVLPDIVGTKHSVAPTLTPLFQEASKPHVPIRFVCPLGRTVPKPGGVSQLSVRQDSEGTKDLAEPAPTTSLPDASKPVVTTRLVCPPGAEEQPPWDWPRREKFWRALDEKPKKLKKPVQKMHQRTVVERVRTPVLPWVPGEAGQRVVQTIDVCPGCRAGPPSSTLPPHRVKRLDGRLGALVHGIAKQQDTPSDVTDSPTPISSPKLPLPWERRTSQGLSLPLLPFVPDSFVSNRTSSLVAERGSVSSSMPCRKDSIKQLLSSETGVSNGKMRETVPRPGERPALPPVLSKMVQGSSFSMLPSAVQDVVLKKLYMGGATKPPFGSS